MSDLMPAPAPAPARRPAWIVPVIAGLVVLLLATGGLAAWALLRPTAASTPTSTQPTRSAPVNVVAPPAPTKTYGAPSPGDFELTVKTLEKKCFGSAGCIVRFRIELAYGGPELDPAVTYEVTYEVTGGEEPLINTLEVTGDQYSTDKEETIDTPRASSKLRATVTGVGKA